MESGNLEDQIQAVIKELSIKTPCTYIEKSSHYCYGYYEVRLKDRYEPVFREGETGEIDKLHAYIPKLKFHSFISEAILKGSSNVIAYNVYSAKGYTWMNDVASGKSSSSSYENKPITLFLNLKRNDALTTRKLELTWKFVDSEENEFNLDKDQIFLNNDSDRYPEIRNITINPNSVGTSVEYQLIDDSNFDEYAADWNRIPGRWATSIRAGGWGHRWDLLEGLFESSYKAILVAYNLNESNFSLEQVATTSPDELKKSKIKKEVE